MRTAILALLVACGGTSAAPDLVEFRSMTPERQCKVTAPRAARCADELMVASLRALDPEHAMGDVANQLEDEPKADMATAARMHEVACMSGPGYTAGIVACWNIGDCKEFAACVMHTPAPR